MQILENDMKDFLRLRLQFQIIYNKKWTRNMKSKLIWNWKKCFYHLYSHFQNLITGIPIFYRFKKWKWEYGIKWVFGVLPDPAHRWFSFLNKPPLSCEVRCNVWLAVPKGLCLSRQPINDSFSLALISWFSGECLWSYSLINSENHG